MDKRKEGKELKKPLKILIPILVILGLVLAAGCAKAPTPAPTIPVPSEAPGLFRESTSGGQSSYDMAESGNADIDHRLVKTGYITLEVSDITESIADVARVASELNGYVGSYNASGGKE